MSKALRAIGFGLAGWLLLAGCSSGGKVSPDQKRADIFEEAGHSALREGNYSDAMRSFHSAAKLNPSSPSLQVSLGIAYAGRGETKLAEEAFLKALKIDPKTTYARFNLGLLYLKHNRLLEAEKQLKIAAEDLVFLEIEKVHYNLAAVYTKMRKPMMVEQQLRLALKANPDYCPANYHLGKILRERDDFQGAAQHLAKSVNGICYNNPQIHYEIGTLLLKNKETDRAKAKLLDVIQLFPASDWAKKAEVTLNMIR